MTSRLSAEKSRTILRVVKVPIGFLGGSVPTVSLLAFIALTMFVLYLLLFLVLFSFILFFFFSSLSSSRLTPFDSHSQVSALV